VDVDDVTVSFVREIYDEDGTLVEVHQKYPTDRGHMPAAGPTKYEG